MFSAVGLAIEPQLDAGELILLHGGIRVAKNAENGTCGGIGAGRRFIVGKRDQEAGTVSVRKRGEGDLGAMELEAFVEKLRGEM